MIAFLSQLIPWEWIAGAAVVVVGMVSMWFGGRKSAKSDAKIKEAAAYRETRERMDNAENDIADDPAALRDWLRERGKQ